MAKRQEYRVAGLNEPISHYTDAVRFGDTLYISGLVPVDAGSNVIGEDAAAQTEQIFKNMGQAGPLGVGQPARLDRTK